MYPPFPESVWCCFPLFLPHKEKFSDRNEKLCEKILLFALRLGILGGYASSLPFVSMILAALCQKVGCITAD